MELHGKAVRRRVVNSLRYKAEAFEKAILFMNELARKGIDRDFLLSRSMLSPATCCLVNPDKEQTVEKAFQTVQNLSFSLRSTFRL